MQGQSTNNTWNHSEYSLMEENTQLGDEECNRSKSVEKDVADLTKSMKDELASKCYEPDYSATILRVPEEMRNDDPGAYSPKVVSIGPFHRSSQNVQHMEQLKWHCLEKFLSCKPEKDLQMYVMEMKKLEREARSCYKGNDEMESEEFVRMMVLDGCFIIQLLFQLEDDFLFVREDGFAPEDPIYGDRWMLPRVAHDMLLLENQLPFFILEQLWGLTRDGPWDALSIRRSVLNFFCNLLPEEHDLEPPRGEVYHILHLLHSSLRATPDPSKDGLQMQTSARRGSPMSEREPLPPVMAYIDPHDQRGSPMSENEPLPQMAYIDPDDRRGSLMCTGVAEMAYINPHDRREPRRSRSFEAYIDPHGRRGSPMAECSTYVDPHDRPLLSRPEPKNTHISRRGTRPRGDSSQSS